MTEQLKELIENAPIKRSGIFINLLVCSNGKYDGFWGENGYDNIILLGYDLETKQYYKITDKADVFNAFQFHDLANQISLGSFNMDIPNEYGVPRIWFSNARFKIDNDLNLSTVSAEFVKKN